MVFTATATMPTRFMRLFGQDSVTVTAQSTIERENREMELALVLDNTGSMKAGGKFDAMRDAALALVDTVYRDVEPAHQPADGGGALRRQRQHRQPARIVAGADRPRVPSTVSDPTDDPFYPSPDGWKGCVMARPAPYDETDDPPSVRRFTSYLWPDDDRLIDYLPVDDLRRRNRAMPP